MPHWQDGSSTSWRCFTAQLHHYHWVLSLLMTASQPLSYLYCKFMGRSRRSHLERHWMSAGYTRNIFTVPAQTPWNFWQNCVGRFWNQTVADEWSQVSLFQSTKARDQGSTARTTNASLSYQFLVRCSCVWSLLVSRQHFQLRDTKNRVGSLTAQAQRECWHSAIWCSADVNLGEEHTLPM